MRLRAQIATAVAALGFWMEATAPAAGSPPGTQQAWTPESATTLLVNERSPLEGVLAGGAPKTAEGFRALAEAGLRTFVDLRAPSELAPEVRALAEEAGLVYETLPIAGDGDLDLASARALDALLHDVSRRPLVLACSSGNRVGALLAVEAFWLHGRSAEEALALGRSAGLTRLEPSVRQLLGLPPAPPAAADPAVTP